jgi:mono/diheme cytochrome c family protein/rhodanese-related sulfurtransferase
MRFVVPAVLAAALIGCGDDKQASEAGPGPHDPPVAAKIDAGVPIDAANPRVARGGELYATYCALCHGPNGEGYVADNAPSLVSEAFLTSANDGFLFGSIERGRPGTPMAAYGQRLGGPLAEHEIRSIIAWLRRNGQRSRPLAATQSHGDARKGLALWTATCAECHGTPSERKTAPHLSNPVFLSLASDAFIRHAIVKGRPGTPMEAFEGKLDDAQIDDLVALVRSWQPVDAPPPKTPTKPVPKDGPVVLHPKGKRAAFTARDDRFVPVDDVKRALDDKRRMVIIDARPASDWIRAHIPGAISMPHYQMDRIDDLPKDGTWIIAYCACPHHASGIVVDELKKRGFANVAILDEGILVWQKRGYPVEAWE